MNIKLMKFESKVIKQHRTELFEQIIKEISIPEYKFESYNKKLIKYFGLKYLNIKTNKILYNYEIIIIKNKTCYTVYCNKQKIKEL